MPHFGHWQTQVFIAALAMTGWTRPGVIDGPINRDVFDRYVEIQRAPTLHRGDVVILDNLATHRSPKAAAILKDIGAWFLFLPPYSPDLNPIEMHSPSSTPFVGKTIPRIVFCSSSCRKTAARTYDQFWKAVGHVCDLFKEEECCRI